MHTPTPSLLKRLPRLSGWLFITFLLLVAVWAIAPQQLPVSLYKLSLVTLAAVVGYWLDRSLFPYARPDVFLDVSLADAPSDPDDDPNTLTLQCAPDDVLLRVASLAMLRRAVIVGCAMLAMGLGA